LLNTSIDSALKIKIMPKFTCRELIKAGLATGALFSATQCTRKEAAQQPNSSPTVITNQIKDVTLRFIGTGVSQVNEIAHQAQKDLGFKIVSRALSTDENNQIAITKLS
jgi:putative spermidine/putrescine transport system substrate-binding protein